MTSIKPRGVDAGDGLCNLLRAEGRADTAQALCQEVSTRAPGAIWAWRRLAFFSLDGGDYEKAVLCFQTALRRDVKNAGAWEGLGFAYQSLARLTAALKVCLLHPKPLPIISLRAPMLPSRSAFCIQNLCPSFASTLQCCPQDLPFPLVLSALRSLTCLTAGIRVCLLRPSPLPFIFLASPNAAL